MAVTGTLTVREMVTDALILSGHIEFGATPNSEDANAAMRMLNQMLKAWQQASNTFWTTESMSLTLTTSGSYTLPVVRPLRVLSARLRRSGVDIPMIELSRGEYDDLPNKDATGVPTQFHYDRSKEAATFYVWPVLSAASGETVQITYEREVDDISDLSQTLDAPAETWEAVKYNLAARIQDAAPTMQPSPLVQQRAMMLLSDVRGFDAERSVFFRGPDA